MPLDVIAEVVRLDCAWCKTTMRDGVAPISHGICRECAELVKVGIDPTMWNLPAGQGITEDWLDSFIATQLADVLARRHYGLHFKQLSTEDRTLLRGESEAFVARQTWIAGKR